MTRLLLIFSLFVFSCSPQKKEDVQEQTTEPATETVVEQLSNQSDILFGEVEDLFAAGNNSEAAQKLYEAANALKSELEVTPGVSADRIDSVTFFLDEIATKLEDETGSVTEEALVTALYKSELMAAHDYLVYSATHIENEELEDAQEKIVHATNKMMSSAKKAATEEHRSRLNELQEETEQLMNNLETEFQKDASALRAKLEKLRSRIKELERHILNEY
ncbi:MAG: hypothetical protein RJQ09_07030 [Cyclobacteriaceae bacterium]